MSISIDWKVGAPPTASPLKRSIASRIIRFTAIGALFTTIGFVAALAPTYQTWQSLLRPPSDAETVALYQPPDPTAAAVEAPLQHHSLVQELRTRAEFVEARPPRKIPAQLRTHHLTSGLLMGPGRLVVPPIAFLERGGRSAVQFFYIGGDLCGHPAVVHGGALATVMDEGLARCSFQALPNKIGLTATLELNYRNPVPADTYLVLRATTTKVEGRKAWVEGRLESLPRDGEEPKVFVEATGLFIEPRSAKVVACLAITSRAPTDDVHRRCLCCIPLLQLDDHRMVSHEALKCG